MSPSFIDAERLLSKLLLDSHEELSTLAHIVNGTGCGLYIADSESKRFSWSEIAVRIVLREHDAANAGDYRAAEKSTLAGCSAPLRDADGNPLATLEIDSLHGEVVQSHSLLKSLLITAARAVEERAFRSHYRSSWLLALTSRTNDGAGMLLAVDHAQKIVAADRVAADVLSPHPGFVLKGAPLWSLLAGERSSFRIRNGGDVPAVFVDAHNRHEYAALVTPPPARIWRAPNDVDVHSRPRLHTVRHRYLLQPPARYRGGLTLRVQQRVRDYIDAHLAESVDVDALASVAGLSTGHFARQFKQSVGLTPHNYVMQRRLAKAQELITTTRLALAAVALVTGFADQSHLSRCFREEMGMSPRRFRCMRSDDLAAAG